MVVTLYTNVAAVKIIYESLYEEIQMYDMVMKTNLEVIETGIKRYRGTDLPYQILTGKKSNIMHLIYGCHIPMMLSMRRQEPILKTIIFDLRV